MRNEKNSDRIIIKRKSPDIKEKGGEKKSSGLGSPPQSMSVV